jgi:hypothetical protein
VVPATERQIDSILNQSYPLQTVPRADFDKNVNRALLEYSRSDSFLDIITVTLFDDERIDPLCLQQLRENQSSWPCANDSYLHMHVAPTK